MGRPHPCCRRWRMLWTRRRLGTSHTSSRRRRLRTREQSAERKAARKGRTVARDAQLAFWRVRFAARDADAVALEYIERRLDLRRARRCRVDPWERGQRQDGDRARGSGRLRSTRVSKEQPAPNKQRRTTRARLWLCAMARERGQEGATPSLSICVQLRALGRSNCQFYAEQHAVPTTAMERTKAHIGPAVYS